MKFTLEEVQKDDDFKRDNGEDNYDNVDLAEDMQPPQSRDDLESNATNSIDQICKYSHKILRKYVVNGMIDLVDGPQLHNLVDARDYRIICIMEVFS